MGSFALVRAIAHANRQTEPGHKAAGAGGVLAALARDGMPALLDAEAHPPVRSVDSPVGDVAEVAAPAGEISRRREIALDVIWRSRQDGLPFSFLAFDGEYGHLPWLPGELDSAGETFLAEIHRDLAVYLDDPTPVLANGRSSQVRASLRLRTRAAPTSATAWMSVQPTSQWRRLAISDGRKNKVRADYLAQRVWVWDGKSPLVSRWHLLVCRQVDGEWLRFCLSNAEPDASVCHLAKILERAFLSRDSSTTPRARSAWHW
ncbi:transposase [Accumulibacter sp.]|uniref:transposase n=1 Tax=Accumulibacter sp. TaxID=2053492 RepID=UPI0028C3F0CF|nr:transposase [Accumulibacter sp.]